MKTAFYENLEKFDDMIADYKVYYQHCGHSLIIEYPNTKKIRRYCNRLAYKDKRDWFKAKLTEAILNLK